MYFLKNDVQYHLAKFEAKTQFVHREIKEEESF
jgi:hypothetical protein